MQTTYTANPIAGDAGTVSNGRPSDIETRFAEGALIPGTLAVRGAGAKGAAPVATTVAPTAVTALGIVMLDKSRVDANYAQYDTLPVGKKGCFWVTFEPDATPAHDSAVYVRHTANGAGKLVLGAFRSTTDSDNAVLLAGAKFIQVKGTVAEIELNLPQ